MDDEEVEEYHGCEDNQSENIDQAEPIIQSDTYPKKEAEEYQQSIHKLKDELIELKASLNDLML